MFETKTPSLPYLCVSVGVCVGGVKVVVLNQSPCGEVVIIDSLVMVAWPCNCCGKDNKGCRPNITLWVISDIEAYVSIQH